MNNNQQHLPAGWEQAVANTGQTYYYCLTTGETRWDLPEPVHDDQAMVPPMPLQFQSASSDVDGISILKDNQPLSPRSMRDSELSSLTAGQIADLCFLQQRHTQGGGGTTILPYVPLNRDLLELEQRPAIEKRRIEIRLYNLQEQMNRIKMQQQQ